MKSILIFLTFICLNSVTPAQDVVLFSAYKNSDIQKSLQKNYHGLNDEKALEALLDEQNYVEVLKHLWTETNVSKRCAWLEKKVDEGHPILIFELAEDYYMQDPTLECYLTKTMPWIIAGATRTLLDARCTEDASVKEAAEQLLNIYQQRILARLLESYTLEEIESYIALHDHVFKAENTHIQTKVFKPVSENKTIPSPRWVFIHGQGSFTGEDCALPECQYTLIRQRGALEILAMVSSS